MDANNTLPTTDQAARVRAAWMRLMGVPEDEIKELCQPDPEHPFDLAAEMCELEAAKELAQSAPSYEKLLNWIPECLPRTQAS